MGRLSRFLAVAALGGWIVPAADASITEGGAGLIHGKNHLFSLTAPPGWVLDNESGLAQGVVVVFYPKDQSWGSASMTCYTRSREIGPGLRTPEDVARATIKDFRAAGNPGYVGRKVKTIRATSGAVGEIWHYHGDQWGNYEAAAYFPGKKRINAIIYTSRSKADFESGLPAFEQLARSYDLLSEMEDPTPLLQRATEAGVGLTDDPSRSTTKFDDVAVLAHVMGDTPEGKKFETAVLEKLGQVIVNAAGQCFGRVKDGTDVQLVLIFDANGTIMTARFPEGDEGAACLAEKLRGKRGPRPPRAQWMMLFKFRVQDSAPKKP